MKWKVLLFFISCLPLSVSAQWIRVEALRAGIDPLRLPSLFFDEKKGNKFYNFRSFEAFTEIICFQRVSAIAEFGHSKNHLLASSGEYHHYSSGNYFRIGFDFNLTDEMLDRVEHYIGWRLGSSNYKESAVLDFMNDYFDHHYTIVYDEFTKNHLWGELLLAWKYKLREHKQSDFYLSWSLRFKFSNVLPKESYPSLLIPGYGPFGKYIPGITFGAFYHFKIPRSYLDELKYRESHEGSYRLYQKKYMKKRRRLPR